MSTVWLTIPSARPVEQIAPLLSIWSRQGYKIALWRDIETPGLLAGIADYVRYGPYPGYPQACNELIAEVMRHDASAQWFVAAGDDTQPDLNKKADVIARECEEHFQKNFPKGESFCSGVPPMAGSKTFGVMQPIGDRWADDIGVIIERIAGSPWLGREFCLRANGGNGPLWSEYTHCYADEELWHVAKRLGIYWERRDLIHYHDHWTRGPRGTFSRMPDFLKEANSPQHWQKYGDLFRARKAAGFPGSEPL